MKEARIVHYLIPFIWKAHNRQIYRDRNILLLKGWRWGAWGIGGRWLRGERFFLVGNEMFLNYVWVYNPVNILKVIELYTLNPWIMWSLNCIFTTLWEKYRTNFLRSEPSLFLVPIALGDTGPHHPWQIDQEAVTLARHSRPQSQPVSWRLYQGWMTNRD